MYQNVLLIKNKHKSESRNERSLLIQPLSNKTTYSDKNIMRFML